MAKCFLLYIVPAALAIFSSAVIVWFYIRQKNKELKAYKIDSSLAMSRLAETIKKLSLESETLTKQVSTEREASNGILKEASSIETKFHELSKKFGEEVIFNENLKKEVERWQAEAEKSLSQRKSSEVRTGKIAEHFAPLQDDFPYPIDSCIFAGMPIDIIAYDIDGDNPGIHFVEVKSGNADLSSKQRRIRDLINSGKVSFEIYRIGPKT